MNLYRVILRTHHDFGINYVVAPDSERAYERVKADLDTRDYGFYKDRALDRVELVAEDVPYPVAPRLYLPEPPR